MDALVSKALANSRLTPTERVKDKIRANMASIRELHPEWENSNDTRWAWFTGSKMALQVAQISFIFVKDYLYDEDWWESKTESHDNSNTSSFVSEYNITILYGTSNLIFTVTEELFRSIVGSYRSESDDYDRKAFYSVYNYLLKKLDMKEYINILDMHRLIRNTIHTNGVYMPPTRGNRIITYRSAEYKFEDGKAINFFKYEMLLNLVEDYNDLIYRIIMHENIESICHIPRLHKRISE